MKLLDKKKCIVCGVFFYPKNHQNPSRFNDRKACGRSCAATIAARSIRGAPLMRIPRPVSGEMQRVERLYAEYREQGVNYASK